jgi:PAS domain S-box-containing protein
MKDYRSPSKNKSHPTPAIQDSEQHYHELFNNTLGLFCTHDMSGNILSLNPAAAASLERSEEDLLGKNLSLVLPAGRKEMFDDYLKQVATHKIAEGVMRVISASGKDKYWAYRNIRIDCPGSPSYVVGLSQDITHRIQLEKELKKAKEKETEMRKSRELFFTSMSHELRTPLNAIRGFTKLLLKNGLSRIQKEYINAVDFAGQNLMVVVNDILDMGKLEAGKMTFEEIPFYPHKVVSSTVDLMKVKANEKGIRLIKKINSGVPELISGDPVRLNQILINLIGNALKFTEKGSVTIAVEAKKNEGTGFYITFSISDTGIGIAEDTLPLLFNSYSQAGADIARKFGGSGLGLSIVKQLTEAQYGTIQVRSTPGKGSTFTVSIPYKKANTDKLSVKQNEIFPLTPTRELNILLAEDNLLNQKLAVEMLKEYGHSIEIAKNGREAVKKIKNQQFDMILMDVRMPVMDGWEATRLIRTELESPKKNTPIIALTASITENEIKKCMEAGMNDYISKPFAMNVLNKKMEALLIDLPKRSLIDLSYLNEALKNNKELILEVMKLFISIVPQIMTEIESLYGQWNREKLVQSVHKIKSNLKAMGMDDAVTIANLIEADTNQKISRAKLAPMIRSLSQYCNEAIKELKEIRKTMS